MIRGAFLLCNLIPPVTYLAFITQVSVSILFVFHKCVRVCTPVRVSLDTLTGSQTACSGPLEINGIPAPNSYYQGVSDLYLLCGKCGQSPFILAHTLKKHARRHTLSNEWGVYNTCKLLGCQDRDILPHANKSSRHQVHTRVVNEGEMNVWGLQWRASLQWIGLYVKGC